MIPMFVSGIHNEKSLRKFSIGFERQIGFHPERDAKKAWRFIVNHLFAACCRGNTGEWKEESYS